MNVRETALPGVRIVEPRVFRDDRGYFLETWSRAAYAAAGTRLLSIIESRHIGRWALARVRSVGHGCGS